MTVACMIALATIAETGCVAPLARSPVEGRYPKMGARVTLLASSQVMSPMVHLRDVASLSGDAVACERLAAATLAPAPHPGRTRVIGRSQVAAVVESIAPGSDVRGADAVRVISASQRVEADDLRAAAKRALLERFPGRPADLEVEFLSRGRALEVPPGEVKLRAEAASSSTAIRSRSAVTVGVRVMVDGREAAQVSLPVRIRVFGLVAFAESLVERGGVIPADAVSYRRTELLGRAAAPGFDPLRHRGWTARRRVAPGAILTADMLRAPLLVRRGEEVRVSVRRQGLMVEARAVALDEGALGERIRLRMDGALRMFRGLVTGEREAALE